MIKITNLKKTSRYFYHSKVSQSATSPLKAIQKWNQLLDSPITDCEWKIYFNLPYLATKETKLVEFQIKVLHRILPTNKWLYKCKLTNTATCSFCLLQIETIEHLFWECTIVKNLWLKLDDWLSEIDINANFNDLKMTILGNPDLPHSINHISLMKKQYIYKTKLN